MREEAREAAQRATGALTAKAVRIEVPVVDAARTPAGPSDVLVGAPGGSRGSGGSGGPGSNGTAGGAGGSGSGKAVVRIGFPRTKGSRRGVRRLRATLRASRPVTGLRVTLRDARGRTVGAARVARVAGRRSLTLRLSKGLRPGRHRVTVTYSGGRLVRVVRFRR